MPPPAPTRSTNLYHLQQIRRQFAGTWVCSNGRSRGVKIISHHTSISSQIFQPGTSFYSKYGIMAFHDVATGAEFIIDTIAQAIFFSRYVLTRSISLLFQYTTLYITHSLFLSYFSTQLCISPTLYFSPVSVHNIVYHPLSISLLFQYTTLYITHLFFSPVSVHNTVYHPRSISLLFQYTTLYFCTVRNFVLF